MEEHDLDASFLKEANEVNERLLAGPVAEIYALCMGHGAKINEAAGRPGNSPVRPTLAFVGFEPVEPTQSHSIGSCQPLTRCSRY